MLHTMRDAASGRVEQIELSTGKVYDAGGKLVRELSLIHI